MLSVAKSGLGVSRALGPLEAGFCADADLVGAALAQGGMGRSRPGAGPQLCEMRLENLRSW